MSFPHASMSLGHHGTYSGGVRDLVQPSQLERLLRGQQRLESGMEEVRKGLDRLNDQMGSTMHHQATYVSTLTTMAERIANRENSMVDNKMSFAQREISDACIPSHVASGLTEQAAMLERPALERPAGSAEDVERAVGVFRHNVSSVSSQITLPVHSVFESLMFAVSRSNYAHVKELVANATGTALLHRSSAKSVDTAHPVRNWHPVSIGCVVHPASRLCSVMDAVRAVFLLNDLIMIPYVLAWDLNLEGWLYALSCLVVAFWSTDMIFNFLCGYISEGSVVMNVRQIGKQYLKRGFVVDFTALTMEAVDLVVGTIQRRGDSADESRSLKVFKALRFVKVARLARIVAKLREGLLSRIQSGMAYWIHVHGLANFQHSLNFMALIFKLLFVIAWLGHIGSCLWYALERSYSDQDVTWQDSLPIDTEISTYLQGLYWSVSTMFSGSSYSLPVKTSEVFLATLWLVMGALFVTSITSTLAATLIDAHEKQQDMNKKVQSLTTFMAQRKTPVLLSLAIQANFHEKLLAPKHLSELDLPFLELVAPTLRAALREKQYAACFLHLPFFRMLSTVHDGILQALTFEASVLAAKEGEEIFHAQQEMVHAFLLSRGTMRYGFMPSSRSVTRYTLDESLHNFEGLKSLPSGRPSELQADAWICELALLVTWWSLGALSAITQCELLLVSTDHFIRVVTSVPSIAAVTAAYAVHAAKAIHDDEEVNCTDIEPGIDADAVICTMDGSIRGGLISKPALDVLRRQHRLRGIFLGEDLTNVEDEVHLGKCHLVMGPEGPHSVLRVVHLVVLQLANKDGNLCVQLADSQDGLIRGKFCLPDCKVTGNEPKEHALKRLLDRSLYPLTNSVRIIDDEMSIEYAASASSSGMRTKYIKHIFTARLEGDIRKDLSWASHPDRARLLHAGSMKSEKSGPGSQGSNAFRRGKSRAATWLNLPHKGSSWDLAAMSSAFSGQPFGLDGPKHAFAVLEKPDVESTVGQRLRVYRWIDESDFDRLIQRREEVEADLAPVACALTPSQWQALLAWQVIPDGECSEDVPVEDNAPFGFNLTGVTKSFESHLDEFPAEDYLQIVV